MAYQNVGTPRFFIDNYMYLRALGLDPQAYIDETDDINDDFVNYLGNENQWLKTPLNDETIFTLSPEISKPLVRDNAAGFRTFIPCGDMVGGMDFSGNMKWYGAMLNHNLGDCDVRIQNVMFMGGVTTDSIYNIGDEHETGILNMESATAMYNGSSIFYSNLSPSDMQTAEGEDFLVRFTGFQLTDDAQGTLGDTSNLQVGAISMGVMYTMPNSVDLKLTMEIEFDGYDEVKTMGGSTLTNITQTGAPVWTNNGEYNSPFSVGNFSDSRYLGGAKRNGRRSWNLKFSYISDENIFSSNYSHNTWLNNDSDNSGYNQNDLDVLNYGEIPILNKSFDDWSDTAQSYSTTGNPDNWRVFANGDSSYQQTNTTKVVESTSGVMNFIQQAGETTNELAMNPKMTIDGVNTFSILEVGAKYRVTLVIDEVAAGTCRFQAFGTNQFDFTTAGTKVVEFTAGSSECRITTTSEDDAADFKISSVKFEKSNPTDFAHNMFTDDSFMAQVWNKTLGGALPFIFQPDSNNDNPDQFCIAKFDMDSLNIKQVAFKTYSFGIKIIEVW